MNYIFGWDFAIAVKMCFKKKTIKFNKCTNFFDNTNSKTFLIIFKSIIS